MIALYARYDGKVIVPETPLALPANQGVRISIEPIPSEPPPHPRSDFREWIGLVNVTAPQKPHDPGADEDALREKGCLPDSTSPRGPSR